MVNRGLGLIIVLLASNFTFPTYANTLLVPNGYPTIQSAINASSHGDTVLVSPGTYFENLDFSGKAITVASIAGPEVTIIDGRHRESVVNFGTGEGVNSILKGFTIQHGYSTWGSGVSLFVASPTIVSNIFQYNDEAIGYWGAAIGGWSSSPVIEQNLFRYNTGDDQFLTGVIAFVNSSSPLVANNLFVSNSCRAINMTLPTENSPVVINNTIIGNPVGIHVDARVNTSRQLYFNNLLFGNTIGLEVVFGSPQNYPTWANNLVFGGNDYHGIPNQTGLNGNLSSAPLFVSAAIGDYRLAAGSPCIDAGRNDAPGLPATDFLGVPRILAGVSNRPPVVDIGAFEFNPDISLPSPPTVQCPATLTAECAQPVTVAALVGKADGGGLTVLWRLNAITIQTNVVPAGNPPTSASVSFIAVLPVGTNLVEVTAIDDSGNTASGMTTVVVADTTAPVIVSASASPNVLLPPKHKMVTVTVSATVVDACSAANWQITNVESSQPGSGRGNGKNAMDWQILDDHTVALRSERSGNTSRTYTITLQAQDAAGNSSLSTAVTVTVP